jgi:hypothetical protein
MGLFHLLHTPVCWFKNVSGIVPANQCSFFCGEISQSGESFSENGKQKHEKLLIFRDVFRHISKEKN